MGEGFRSTELIAQELFILDKQSIPKPIQIPFFWTSTSSVLLQIIIKTTPEQKLRRCLSLDPFLKSFSPGSPLLFGFDSSEHIDKEEHPNDKVWNSHKGKE